MDKNKKKNQKKNNHKNKKRLDQRLIEEGFAKDQKSAEALIRVGKVIVNDQRVELPATLVALDAKIRVKGLKSFVGRGATKLAPALKHFDLLDAIENKDILDIGASTGGFTDLCLQLGARHVTAVDVGTNQLDWSLRSDERVTCLEKTDIRQYIPDRDFSLVVCDISFISLLKVIKPFFSHQKAKETKYLFLVKPQFEMREEDVPKGGIIENKEDRKLCVLRVKEGLLAEGLHVRDPFDCPVPGRNGNQETFLLAEKKP